MEIQEVNKFIKDFEQVFNKKNIDPIPHKESVYRNMIKVTEEVGELSDQVLGNLAYQREDKRAKYSKEAMAGELADSLIALFYLAHDLDIDVEEALQKTITKVKGKFNF